MIAEVQRRGDRRSRAVIVLIWTLTWLSLCLLSLRLNAEERIDPRSGRLYSTAVDSGLEIMAQPPGKRNQTIGLLSGGEKALTAVALLISVFKYKPSPFCILDEVDAPLDDANIGRFVRMLEGLKEQTQFVLITHSRKTMEIADQLYGVTMEEPGVSKLVSVKLS